MSLFTLHADYDQNGVVSRSPAEYQLRKQFPGAVFLPNVDADGVAFPTQVRCGTLIPPDSVARNKLAKDNDLLPLMIRIEKGTVAADYSLALKIDPADEEKFRLYDATRPLPLARFFST
jgi:hypothetical protein